MKHLPIKLSPAMEKVADQVAKNYRKAMVAFAFANAWRGQACNADTEKKADTYYNNVHAYLNRGRHFENKAKRLANGLSAEVSFAPIPKSEVVGRKSVVKVAMKRDALGNPCLSVTSDAGEPEPIISKAGRYLCSALYLYLCRYGSGSNGECAEVFDLIDEYRAAEVSGSQSEVDAVVKKLGEAEDSWTTYAQECIIQSDDCPKYSDGETDWDRVAEVQLEDRPNSRNPANRSLAAAERYIFHHGMAYDKHNLSGHTEESARRASQSHAEMDAWARGYAM